MSQDKSAPDQPDRTTGGTQRIGREEIVHVFRSEGGNEFSGQHRPRPPVADNQPASGPTVYRSIDDASVRRDSDEINDAKGPSRRREMLDSAGPVVPRRLDGTYGTLPPKEQTVTPPRKSINSIQEEHAASSSELPSTVHVETFRLHMEDRLAQMKASQRETLEKMRQLEQENSNDANAVSNHDDSHTFTENTASSSIVKVSDGTLTRYILGESLIHPAIRDHIAGNHRDIVEEVMDAISRERIVVIGMSGNPFVSKTKKLLNALGIDYAYLQYGSYFSQWRRRNALKMWTGWPTFPMIFINGKLVGGYQNLKILSDSEELQRLAKE